MLIDWFTVLAQIVNFLILVALMKRFLYGPLIAAIDAREQSIAARLAEGGSIAIFGSAAPRYSASQGSATSTAWRSLLPPPPATGGLAGAPAPLPQNTLRATNSATCCGVALANVNCCRRML